LPVQPLLRMPDPTNDVLLIVIWYVNEYVNSFKFVRFCVAQ